jgi:threonine/homoserine/homoserine lactone efflux protein
VPEVARILLYGLVAAASPTALLATLVVLGGGRGRVNGIALAAAVLLGQLAAFLVAFFIGSAVTPKGNDTAADYVELVAGLALLAIALHGRPPHEQREAGESPRTEALFEKLKHVTPAVSFGIGLLLGIGAKRLTITILAAASVALSGLAPAEEVGLGALYVLIATSVVWIPVGIYLFFGTHADELMERARVWITDNERMLTFISALAVGGVFVVDALVRLVS